MDVYVRYSLLVLALSLTASGCKGTDSSIELLESELRWMEDQLYLMDRELAHTQAKLDSSQRYNNALQKELKKDSESDSSAGSGSRSNPGSTYEEETFDESDLVIPEIDLGPDADDDTSSSSGAPAIDESVMQNGIGDAADEAPAIIEPDADSSDGLPTEPLPQGASPEDIPNGGELDLEEITHNKVRVKDHNELRVNDVRVARIVLNSRLSGGYDFDGKPGDDGLLLVIEPQNTSGQYLPLPGDLTITVEDPRRAGNDARVARWDFNAVETVDHMKQTLLGRGIHLKLPWPNQPPDQSMLKVFATYHSTDGRKLDAVRNIKVDLGSSRDPIARSGPASPFKTGLLPNGPQARRTDTSVSSLPSPPRAPSPNVESRKESRLAHQPWQPSRSKKTTNPRQKERSQPAQTTQPKWRPYR